MRRLYNILVTIFILTCPLFSQTLTRDFAPGARATGIGRSGVVGVYDPSVLFWNPAALGAIRYDQLSLSIHDPFTLNHLSIAHFMPARGALGAHMGKSGVGNAAVQYAGVGYSHQLPHHLYLGVSITGSQIGDQGWTTAGLGLLFKPESSPFNTIDFFDSPLITGKLAIGFAVVDMPLGKGDYNQQTRVGLSYELPFAATLYYAHHFYVDDESNHLGLSAALADNIRLMGGLKDYNPAYWGFGLEVAVYNSVFTLGYDKHKQRAVFSTSILLGQPPQVMAEQEYQRARNQIQLKDRRGALQAVHRSLSYDPENANARLLGQTLDPIIRNLDQQVDSLFRRAQYWESQQKYVNAAANYLNILKIDPRNKKVENAIAKIRPRVNYQTNIWFAAAEKMFNDGELERAKDIFQSILLIRPNHPQAMEYLEKIDSILKKEAEDRYFRGLGFYSQRNFAKAREEFEAILKIDPDHQEAKEYLERIDRESQQARLRITNLLQEAETLERRGSLLGARQRYQTILSLEPGNSQATQRLADLNQRIIRYVAEQYALGEKAYGNNRLGEAQRIFRNILSYSPNHAGARRYLARISEMTSGNANQYLERAEKLYQQKQWNNTLALLDSLLNAYPENSHAAQLRQQTLEQIDIAELIESAKSDYLAGRYIEAIQVFDSVLEKAPDNEEARELREMCQKNLTDQVDAIFNQGIRLYTEEKYQLAIREFDRILGVNPSHKGAQEYKQRAQERLQALESLK